MFPVDGAVNLTSTRCTMNNKTPIATALLLYQADLRAFQACIEAGLQRLGLQELDGLSIQQWIDKRRAKELEAILLSVGDKDPAMHDALSACIADALKSSQPKH